MPYLYGHNLRLRSVERTDIPQFLRWINDPEVVENLEVYAPMGTVEEEVWFDAMKARPIDEHALVIEVHPEGSDDKWVVIGNTSFFPINQKARSVEIGIMIGEKDYWNKGYGTETMRTMSRYGFEELNLNRIWLRVYDTNPRARKAYEKAGFVYEGTLRQAEYKHGRYIDVHVMSILKSDWIKN
jgi:RimJ/RimL family protein N-acetyltransferase